MNTILIFLATTLLLIFITRRVTKIPTMIGFYSIAIVGIYLLQLMIPEGFADDQVEYFEFVKGGESDLWVSSFKNTGLFLITFIPIRYLQFDIFSAKVLLFSLVMLSQLYLLFRIRSLLWFFPILIIVPSYLLHSGLFIREPMVYMIIPFLIYSVMFKNLASSILWLLVVAVLRPEAALIVSPILIYHIKTSDKLKFLILGLYVVGLLYVMTNTILEDVLNGYRLLFDVQSFLINLDSIIFSAGNLFLGSRSLDIAGALLIFESVFVFFLIFAIKDKTPILFAYLVAILLVGSISANSGFIIRIRSSLVLVTVLWYLCERYKSRLDFRGNT
jgi:hypothetical protein